MPFLFLRRIGEIVFVVFKYLLKRKVKLEDGVYTLLDGPHRLLCIFQDLGGVFLKFGQILSMRFDLLPMHYSLVLMNLLDNTPALPNDDLFSVFQEDFGIPISNVFSVVEKPIGVASFAQVYRGRYQGQDVVIKIQKPGVRRNIETDLSIFSFFTSVAGFFGLLRVVSMREVVTQMRDWLTEELDYRLEAQNARTVYGHVCRHKLEKNVNIPLIFEDLTSERILVQSFLPGLQVTKLIGGTLADYARVKSLLDNMGSDPMVVANFFVRDLMRQYFIDGFFHADPHPGNLMIFPNNGIGYIDFGIIGKPKYNSAHFLRFIDGATSLNMREMAAGLVDFGYEQLERQLGSIARDPKFKKVSKIILDFISEHLREDLAPIVSDWHAATGSLEEGLSKRSSAVAFFKVVKAAEKYLVRLPPDVIAFIRTLLIVDMVCLRLSPSFDMVKAARTFFEMFPSPQIQRLRLVHSPDMEKLQGVSFDAFTPEVEAPQKHISPTERELYARENFIERVYILADKYPDLYDKIKKYRNLFI